MIPNRSKSKKFPIEISCEFPKKTCWNINYIFFSELASGRNPRNPAIWLVPRAGSFLRSCPLTRAESLAASFTSLFVVVNEQNRWFRTIFLLKLALLLALAREKWILLFRQIKTARKTAKVLQSCSHEPFIRHFSSVCRIVFHFCCLNLDSAFF